MVLIISNISFDTLKSLKSQEAFVKQSNFFYLTHISERDEIFSRYNYILQLYPWYSRQDLYITMVTELYFKNLNFDFKDREYCINDIIPASYDDEKMYSSKYHRLLDEDRSILYADIDRTLSNLRGCKTDKNTQYFCEKVQHLWNTRLTS